jgi:hypothetical protein
VASDCVGDTGEDLALPSPLSSGIRQADDGQRVGHAGTGRAWSSHTCFPLSSTEDRVRRKIGHQENPAFFNRPLLGRGTGSHQVDALSVLVALVPADTLYDPKRGKATMGI